MCCCIGGLCWCGWCVCGVVCVVVLKFLMCVGVVLRVVVCGLGLIWFDSSMAWLVWCGMLCVVYLSVCVCVLV